MRTLFVRFALPVAVGLVSGPVGAACTGPTGSCLFTSDAGYDCCEEFLGTEFNSSVAANNCAAGNGSYSPNPCSTAGALGTCEIGSGTADNYQYTYTPAGGAAPSVTTIKSACGVAGGRFTASRP